MKTTSRSLHLCSWLLRAASLSLALVFCASAWANSSEKNVVTRPQAVTEVKQVKKYYVMSTASAIPLPLEQIGVFPTTTHPILILGRRTQISR